MNETTKPTPSTAHSCGVICATPIAFSPLPMTDFSSVYTVATNIVGMERKKENSNAAARDIPQSWPAAMVDMEREVPGKTAERIWQVPIHRACAEPMSSILQVWMGLPLAP